MGRVGHYRVGFYKLPPADLAVLEALVRTRGMNNAAQDLGSTPCTIDGALGPGVRERTRDRLVEAIAKLRAGGA